MLLCLLQRKLVYSLMVSEPEFGGAAPRVVLLEGQLLRGGLVAEYPDPAPVPAPFYREEKEVQRV